MTPVAALLRTRKPFALLRRGSSVGHVDLYTGDCADVPRLADLTVPPVDGDVERHDLIAVVPYRQITERGYACRDDATPLLTLRVGTHTRLDVAQTLATLPDDELHVTKGGFDLSDDAYAATAQQIITDEIGRGTGSNFVLRRTFRAGLRESAVRAGLTMFGRLLRQEPGAYWVFLIHSGDRVLVGATPERHVSLLGGVATMNPISGTYRYPGAGPSVDGVLRFLGDAKESNELRMVVDEELKMMGQFCPAPRVAGPRLREMSQLAHTEYLIEGHTDADVRDILRATMFAPTVVGSPLPSACRVVAEYEATGRGYYGGVLALIGQRDGTPMLDSAICIRAADIRGGTVTIDVGATLVRDSDPRSEAAETRAKAAGLLRALGATTGKSHINEARAPRLGHDARVGHALAARNRGLARFWFDPPLSQATATGWEDRHVVIVDAEDGFTTMLAEQVRSLGLRVRIRSYLDPLPEIGAGADAVVVGPGPGDPRNLADPKIAALRLILNGLLRRRTPVLSVCLGHQVLAGLVGLPLRRKERPTQGMQREIDFDGRRVRVGFYNTFAAYSATDTLVCRVTGEPVTVLRDPRTGEVFGLRRPGMASVQFHVESILTEDGPTLLAAMLRSTLDTPVRISVQSFRNRELSCPQEIC